MVDSGVTTTVQEDWRPIPGYEGLYEASDQGRIRALRFRNNQAAFRRRSPLMLRACPDGHGYPKVGLSPQNGTKDDRLTYKVATLVLLAFRGPAPPGCEASHLNGDRSDSRLANLVWESRRANHARKRDHGTLLRGSTIVNARLTEALVTDARHRYAAGETLEAIAESLGVNWRTIHHAVVGRTWRHADGPITRRRGVN